MNALEYAFYGGLWCRALYMLMLYGLVGLGIPREAVLNFEALPTAPLLTLAVYFSAKRLSGEDSYAAVVSPSPTITPTTSHAIPNILTADGLWVLSRLLARFDSKLPRLLQAFFITSSPTYTVRALCNLV